MPSLSQKGIVDCDTLRAVDDLSLDKVGETACVQQALPGALHTVHSGHAPRRGEAAEGKRWEAPSARFGCAQGTRSLAKGLRAPTRCYGRP